MERQFTWAGTDDWRAEWAHVRQDQDRFVATGVQLGVAPVPYRLDYRLEADAGPGWATRLLEATALGAGWRRSARLERDETGGWSYRQVVFGKVALPDPVYAPAELEGALDCDLGLSPLTNTMPILRHGLHQVPGSAELTMAWMSVPDLA